MMVMILNIVLSLLCFHAIIIFVLTVDTTFFSIFCCFTFIFFLINMKRCFFKKSIYSTPAIIWFKMALNYCNGTLAEINIGYFSTNSLI